MNPWENYKKWFYAWEGATAKYLETVMQSPLLLEPAGACLSAALRAKSAGDKAMATGWGTLGLPTKRDQERTLHALNEIQSRLIDMEERLAGYEVAEHEAAEHDKAGPTAP